MSYMPWKVEFTKKCNKQFNKLSANLKDVVMVLVMDMEEKGPIRGDWPNFSRLDKNEYHCHLKKGRPTYVACWRILSKKDKIIEVYYAGTHEKAPY